MLANPVAIDFDEKGRLFVSETYRYRTSVLDIRDYMGMLEQDLANRTIEDRAKMQHEVFGDAAMRQAGAVGYVLVRDTKCRLFGYHGLMDDAGGFSLDHMFGF